VNSKAAADPVRPLIVPLIGISAFGLRESDTTTACEPETVTTIVTACPDTRPLTPAVASALEPVKRSCALPGGRSFSENRPNPSMPDEMLVPTTCTVATPLTSLVRTAFQVPGTPEALELLELLEEGAIIPLIVAPAVFPLVGVVGAVGLEGPVGEPVIDDEESFPLHAAADTSIIAAASPRQVMLRMAILRHCLDPAFDGSPRSTDFRGRTSSVARTSRRVNNRAFEDFNLLPVAVDFGHHSVGQHQHRIRVTEVHASDDRKR
jgi:hypothetical protein